MLMSILRVTYMYENRRRDRLQATAVGGSDGGQYGVEAAEQISLTNRTDKENLSFRYVL